MRSKHLVDDGQSIFICILSGATVAPLGCSKIVWKSHQMETTHRWLWGWPIGGVSRICFRLHIGRFRHLRLWRSLQPTFLECWKSRIDAIHSWAEWSFKSIHEKEERSGIRRRRVPLRAQEQSNVFRPMSLPQAIAKTAMSGFGDWISTYLPTISMQTNPVTVSNRREFSSRSPLTSPADDWRWIPVGSAMKEDLACGRGREIGRRQAPRRRSWE